MYIFTYLLRIAKEEKKTKKRDTYHIELCYEFIHVSRARIFYEKTISETRKNWRDYSFSNVFSDGVNMMKATGLYK